MAAEIQQGRTILVYGVSRGLGAAIFKQFPTSKEIVFGVSRTAPALVNEMKGRYWIQADLANPVESVKKVTQTLGTRSLDILIYNVGIWEERAFSEAYDFESVPAEDVTTMVTTNITAAILNIQALLPNLRL